jgi:hypothetical protein
VPDSDDDSYEEIESEPSSEQPPEEESLGLQLIDNPGGGDCLFYCFKCALASVGVKTSIAKLRRVVADAVTQDQFETLHGIYTFAQKEKEFGIMNDYGFMRGVEDIEGMKQAMMKKSYWGDEMAVRALENKLDVSAIVMTMINGKMARAKNMNDNSKRAMRNDAHILLFLQNQHYQLIECDGRRVMREKQLPADLDEF